MICVPVFSIFGVVSILSLPGDDELALVSREQLDRETARLTEDLNAAASGDAEAGITPSTGEVATRSSRRSITESGVARNRHGITSVAPGRAEFASHPSEMTTFLTRPANHPTRSTVPTPSAVQAGTLGLHNASVHKPSSVFEDTHRSRDRQPILLRRLKALEHKLKSLEDTKVHQDIARLELQLRMMEQHVGQLVQLAASNAARSASVYHDPGHGQDGRNPVSNPTLSPLDERLSELQQRIDQLASRQQRDAQHELPQKQLVELERHLLHPEPDSRAEDAASQQPEARHGGMDAERSVPLPADDLFDLAPDARQRDEQGP